MIIHNLRTNSPDDEMGAAVAALRNLENRERSRVSSLKLARQRLAQKLRIGSGSLENLVRGRVKRIDAAVRDRLHALLIRELEAEIARLEHELQMVRQSGVSLAGDQVGAIETHIFMAKTLLNEGLNGGRRSEEKEE